MNYTITNKSITLVVDGEILVFNKDSYPRFAELCGALFREDFEAAELLASPKKQLQKWLKDSSFDMRDNHLYYLGDRIGDDISGRILEMAEGGADPRCWMHFYARLQRNPSWRSVQQLYGFMQHTGIQITDEGMIRAYKSVNADMKDFYTRTIDNSPGQLIQYPRNRISDDPNHACHEGLHAGSLEYALNFGYQRVIVIVEIDPMNVVCVPYDHTQQKMRICEYKVISIWDGDVLPDFVPADPIPVEDKADSFEKDEDTFPGEEVVEDNQVGLAEQEEDTVATQTDITRAELEKMNFGALRKFARWNANIKGASKMKGTKADLIDCILDAVKAV
jgi:hypothetical protein